MNTSLTPLVVALCAALPVQVKAEGDAEAGARAFRQCQACHVVVNDAGDTLAGRNGRVGPNLYGVAGRTAGTAEGFKYSPAMAAAREAEVVWDRENFTAFVQDPAGYLKQVLDSGSARTPMTFRVRSEKDAEDLFAYLAELAG